MGYSSTTDALSQAMIDVHAETGYDLGTVGLLRQATKGVRRTVKEWDMYFTNLGLDPCKLSGNELLPACVVPKFAAAAALSLRAKLGRLPSNDANCLLVQRKYLELCNRRGVRDVDVVSHQQFVMNTFFGERVLDHVALTRSRLPAWMKWAFPSENRDAPLSC